ncbi:MAG TPA: alpha/beta fold hydrolase [Planctomycetaceae bacterium]|nr:alpha/beta fold hydrolase [Planctomycetaceae bacterium]
MRKQVFAYMMTTLMFVAVGPMNRQVKAQGVDAPQDIVFISKFDGTEQRYAVMLPEGFRTDMPQDLLIALHGHGSDRWQFVKDLRPECLGTRNAAAERNMIFVAPDYRAKTSWMGPAAEADMLQMLDDLHGRFRIHNVIISGGSMGGTSALAFAAMHPDCVDGVVALNGTANLVEYTQFQDAIAASYGGSKMDVPDVYRQRSAGFFPERLTMPIATTTGGKDTLVPPDSTLRLADELKKRKQPVLSIHRPEGGHATNLEDTSAAFKFVFDQLDAAEESLPASTLTPLANDSTIVCLGDSVTGVYYHTGGLRAYPEMLEIAIKSVRPDSAISVINAGISGNTTKDGLARLDNDVLKHNPSLVTISFGLNDMTRIPPDDFRGNLEQLIERCRARQCQVSLCTPNAVIDTPGRPVSKLVEYCDIIRSVGHDKHAPVCDLYQAGVRLKQRAPWTWRLTMSDEIHPNMDGHKRMAEELCRCITGKAISLESVEPPQPVLGKTLAQIAAGKPIKVLAMEPAAVIVEASIRAVAPEAIVEMTTWPVAGKSLSQLEQEAKAKVRSLKPDLVVLTIPATAAFESDDQFVDAVSWIMNWSLSFGHQEWDCVVVHPSVFDPSSDPTKADLIRRLVHAQHLELIDRDAADTDTADSIIGQFFHSCGRFVTKPPETGR